MESVTAPIAIIVLTSSSLSTAKHIAKLLPNAELHGLQSRIPATDVDISFTKTAQHLRALFKQQRAIIGICATGILIRCLASCLEDKHHEPPVLAIAEEDNIVIPLLGGHNGANQLATQLAEQINGKAAITTASDTLFNVALDDPPVGYTLANPLDHKSFAAELLAGEQIKLIGHADWLQQSNLPFSRSAKLSITITENAASGSSQHLIYHPATLAVGIGCERNTSAEEISTLLKETLAKHQLSAHAIAGIFSVDLKMDEIALHAVANKLGVPVRFFSPSTLEEQTPRLANPSEVVFHEVGCHGVAEAAALTAASEDAELIVPKVKSQRATCAVARSPAIIDIDVTQSGTARGSLTVVGIGPGDSQWCTPAASQSVAQATDLVGYSLYLDLLGTAAENKIRHDYKLGEETLRVQTALELAATGKRVALVCSGDPGIYAMAALVFELLERAQNPAWNRCEINIEPGISALQAAAARSGAPLGHDFCTISLSDLLTPWSIIEQRIQAAAGGDFVIAFYNPVSRRRTTQLSRAVDILSSHRPAATPVVLARNLGRSEEQIKIIRLDQLTVDQVDMLTVVLVGSSETRNIGHWVYTPRGYAAKQETLT